MEIHLENREGIAIAALSGEIDGKSAPEIQGKLLLPAENGQRIVLDMSQVTFLSSAGLRVLFLLNRTVQSKSGKIYLAGVSPEIKDTMAITGFLKFFHLTDSLEEAVTAL